MKGFPLVVTSRTRSFDNPLAGPVRMSRTGSVFSATQRSDGRPMSDREPTGAPR